jgi:hypothetical protein
LNPAWNRQSKHALVGLLFPEFRLPAQALPAICTQSFDLFDGRSDQFFHPFFPKKSGQEHAELKGTNSHELHKRVKVLLAERPPVRNNIQVLEVHKGHFSADATRQV